MKLFVSILIPCYNAERWIAQAIESALAQTWPEKEVIVVDDGSTDGSLEVIKSFGHRVTWETGPNRGGNAARNRLLKLAKGDWLQYLDSDDYLRPEKVVKQVQFLREHPDADILFSPFMLEHWSETRITFEKTVVPGPHDAWVLLARWHLPGTGSGIWRKQALVDVAGWNEGQTCCQEHELYLRLLMAAKQFNYCPDGWYVYRQWGDHTVCKRNKRETNNRRLEIEQRAENFLRENHQLNHERLQAINEGRFETARTAWQYDRVFGRQIMKVVLRSQPDFVPEGRAAPPRYQMIYRWFGFQAAEKLAALNRGWVRAASFRPVSRPASPPASALSARPMPGVSKSGPLVSILIPCYNAERWIAQAVESALKQTWTKKEIIVVDDGSTDDSLDIVKSFGGRIRWETGPNRGGNVARNRLLELARGEWLQYLDADDYLLPDKVSNQVNFLANHPESDVIFGPVTIEHWSEKEIRREPQLISNQRGPWILLALWELPQTGAVLWRKQAILDAGGWKPDQPCCQEHELYSRLLMAGKRFVNCQSNGAVYRQWSEQTVCKRDKPETHRRRLEILLRLEDFLRQRKELTHERLQAINQARFETARIAWQYDSRFAAQIMETVRRAQPNFVPEGNAAPRPYQIIYRVGGFRAAERLAKIRRTWLSGHQGSVIESPL